MLVVCDTTPLNYLIQIELVELIPRLYGTACIPQAVFRELLHPAAPVLVRQWAFSLPSWISVQHAGAASDPALLELDRGEQEAIALATALGAQFLLTDDYRARVAARGQGLATLTTLLVLDAAADRGWIAFQDAMDRLLRTNFRVDRFTIDQLIESIDRLAGRCRRYTGGAGANSYGLCPRQLRFVYVQPGAVHGRAWGGDGGAPQR